MDVFFLIFILFTTFVLCSLCGFCCKRKEQGAIFSTPVIVTSTTHQAPGQPYPIQTNQTMQVNSQQMPYPQQQSPYPAYQGVPTYQQAQPISPYPPSGTAPYPSSGTAPYPPSGTAPYPGQPQAGAPFPGAAAATYPPSVAAPYLSHYPPAASQMQPPSYHEIMGQEGYQKQAAYNPSYSQN